MKSAMAASNPLRSGHCNRRIALFFKLHPRVAGHLTSVSKPQAASIRAALLTS
jgi:hypothetical protein